MMKAPRWLLTLLIGMSVTLPTTLGAQRIPNSNEQAFPLLTGLESSVEFWKKVFTEYNAAQLIFFDPLDMSKIYEVMDIGEESRTNEYIRGERARIAEANGVDIDRVYAQRGVRERTGAGLKRAGRYLAQMQQVFIDRGLPPELSFLPVVESSYDIGARSSVGAVGIWQFMPGTARSYMRVDGNIDERRDPLEATRAAASYLNQAYDLLGSWPLAITSYNLGQAGMARAAAEAGSNNLVDIIQRYNHPYFGFAPKQFYAEFLAAVEIGKNFSRYFPELQQDAPQTIKEIALENNTMVQNAIEASGMSRDDFLEWNPGIALHAQVLPAGYRVKLPEGRTMEPLVNIAQVNYFAPAIGRGQRARSGGPGQSQVIHHRVRQGETLSQIASRYGANIRQILQANGLRHANLVRVGTTLRIPRI